MLWNQTSKYEERGLHGSSCRVSALELVVERQEDEHVCGTAARTSESRRERRWTHDSRAADDAAKTGSAFSSSKPA